MANAAQTLALGIVVTAALITPDRVEASDQQETTSLAAVVDPTSVRVRTEDPVLATLIRDATDRSTTFRRLVESITVTDGVVYVVRDGCPRPLRACLAFWIVVAGPHRILRVNVDHRQVGSEAIVSVAHELQHAFEVLSHPSVRTASEMFSVFHRIGTWRGHSFETLAAIKVDVAVRSELQRQGSR